MKKARKLFIILLLFIACLGLSSCTLIFEGLELKTTGYNFRDVEIDGIKGYSVTRYKGEKDVIRIPKTHLFKPVLEIDSCVFSGHSEIKEVHLPKTILKINYWAFAQCPNLSYVSIPDSIQMIDKTSFRECEKLLLNEYENGFYLGNNENPYVVLMETKNAEGSFTIHEQAKLIMPKTFLDNDKITSVVIPDGVQVIDEDTFSNCKQLNDITFGKSVIIIEDNAFYNCSELTRIELPATVTEIGDNAFSKCSKLTQLDIPVSTTEIGSHAFSYCSLLTRVSIPDTITKISDGMFSNCYSLPEIPFGKNVTEIGNYAFACCHGLTRVNIPDSVTKIGRGAFERCENLSEVSVSGSIVVLDDNLFNSCKNLSRVVLNDGTRIIGYQAFSDCISLNSINFPASLREIGSKAFYNCKSLANVDLSNSISKIDTKAFFGCTSLTSFKIPYNLQTLDTSLLIQFPNIKELHFGKALQDLTFDVKTLLFFDNMEYFAEHFSLPVNADYFLNDENEKFALLYSAFFSPLNLDKISVDEENTTFKCVNNCLIRLEDKTIILTTAKNYVLPDDGSATKAYFLGQTETLHIPKSIRFVSSTALACASPDTITVAEDHPVYRCEGNCLIDEENRIIGSGNVYTIPDDEDVCTIIRLKPLKDVFIPKNITFMSIDFILGLEQRAFSVAEDNPVYGTNGDYLIEKSTKTLKRAWDDATLPDDGSVEIIDDYAFYDCKAEEIFLPSSIKIIRKYAFLQYNNLTTIHFAGTIQEWKSISKEHIDFNRYTILCSDGTIYRINP